MTRTEFSLCFWEKMNDKYDADKEIILFVLLGRK